MDLETASLGQLGHRVGLHVAVNLQGMTVNGVGCDDECWVPGVVAGLSEAGTYLTIKLDEPADGDAESRGLLRRASRRQDLIETDDRARIRPKTLFEVMPGGVPDEIMQLARGRERVQVIKQYRALNGATYEEAQAWLRTL